MLPNIFPEMDQFLGRSDKENLLKQHGIVVWFTGLSGSGKSTLAVNLERKLYAQGIHTQVLDGDKIRNGLNKNLGFSESDRIENIRRIAEVGKLFCESGIVTISAFISPTLSIRSMAQSIIGRDNFFEIYLSTPIEICESRDIKGLYKKARAGIINDFTGISSPYEAPNDPKMIIDTTILSVVDCVNLIYEKIFPLIR